MISCRPHYLPREFSSVFFVAVYILPQADVGTKKALNELFSAISNQENTHPEAALLVAGDFNAGKLKSVLPNFYQHVKSATRKELWTTYTPQYSPSPSIWQILIPAYKLKQAVPVTRSKRKWSEDADAMLQDCYASTDSSYGIEEYNTSVTGFLNKCIDEVVPTVTVHTYHNQKPWITGNICTELKR